MWVRGLQPEVCEQQRPKETFSRALQRQTLHVQGEGLRQVLHPPELPAQAHEAPLQQGPRRQERGRASPRWRGSRCGGQADPSPGWGPDQPRTSTTDLHPGRPPVPRESRRVDPEVTFPSHVWQQFGLLRAQVTAPAGPFVAAEGQLQVPVLPVPLRPDRSHVRPELKDFLLHFPLSEKHRQRMVHMPQRRGLLPTKAVQQHPDSLRNKFSFLFFLFFWAYFFMW